MFYFFSGQLTDQKRMLQAYMPDYRFIHIVPGDTDRTIHDDTPQRYDRYFCRASADIHYH